LAARWASAMCSRAASAGWEAASADRAITLDRNHAAAHVRQARNVILIGQAAAALAPVEKAIRLSPRDPDGCVWYEAVAAVVELRKLRPGDTVQQLAQEGSGAFDNPTFRKEYPRIVEGARQAGLPVERPEAQCHWAPCAVHSPSRTVVILTTKDREWTSRFW
jgi:hypothetical protein